MLYILGFLVGAIFTVIAIFANALVYIAGILAIILLLVLNLIPVKYLPFVLLGLFVVIVMRDLIKINKENT